MRSVMISIRPKWCKFIKSGEKRIDVRKTAPKTVPFKAYIYCTGDKKEKFICRGGADMPFDVGNKMVVGEFICDKIIPVSCYASDTNNRILLREQPYTCLTDKQMIDYLGNGVEGKGWHISDLKIYDKPKELTEFGLKRPPQSWCYVEDNE